MFLYWIRKTNLNFLKFRYGIHLAQALTQKVIDRGYRPFVVIRPENDASRNLYKKLGYSKAFETCRVTLNPTKLGLPEDQQIVLQPHLQLAAELAAAAAAAAAVAADEGIEDGRNEDTVSLNEAALRGGHVNGNNDNDEDKDEGIDDDGETQTEEEQPQQNGNAENEEAAVAADGDNDD